jgi:hypothetical protein
MSSRQESAPGAGRRRKSPGRCALSLLAAALAVVAALVAGCGSSGQTAEEVARTCIKVTATLSDGPDPTEDPVGYAEAQILPLRQVHTTDPELKTAISKLANAYAKFFATDGKSTSALKAVDAAANRIDALCPGAGAGI